MLNNFSELPQAIQDHIIKTTSGEYEYRDKSVHVTELLYCLRKSYYRRTELSEEKEIEQRWFFYRGIIFDQLWTNLFPRNQVRVTHRISGGPTIVGKIDFIEMDDEPTLYELKTISNKYAIKNGPKEEHVKQIKFYMWCENIEKVKLIYVSFAGIAIFEIDVSDAESIVQELEETAKLLYDCLVNEKLPPKTDRNWECKYCDFSELCSREESDV
jgi:CRISPR/Cas system-associated exonuclease Cas4 (RecB family)